MDLLRNNTPKFQSSQSSEQNSNSIGSALIEPIIQIISALTDIKNKLKEDEIKQHLNDEITTEPGYKDFNIESSEIGWKHGKSEALNVEKLIYAHFGVTIQKGLIQKILASQSYDVLKIESSQFHKRNRVIYGILFLMSKTGLILDCHLQIIHEKGIIRTPKKNKIQLSLLSNNLTLELTKFKNGDYSGLKNFYNELQNKYKFDLKFNDFIEDNKIQNSIKKPKKRLNTN